MDNYTLLKNYGVPRHVVFFLETKEWDLRKKEIKVRYTWQELSVTTVTIWFIMHADAQARKRKGGKVNKPTSM